MLKTKYGFASKYDTITIKGVINNTKTGPYVLTDIYKEKGIVLLRLNQQGEALKAFNKLEELLHD